MNWFSSRDYIPAGKLSLEKAFEVYQNGYMARLTDTLGDTYEAVWRVLGDEEFLALAKEFILSHPSTSYNLGDYSFQFISFLAAHPVAEDFPFLVDLARLGWMQKESFNAPMEMGLAGEALLQLLGDENARARFVAHVRLLSSEFALFDIWNALMSESDPPEAWDSAQSVIVYKCENQVFVKPVESAVFAALQGISEGTLLLDACESLSEVELASLFEFLARSSLIQARNI